MKGVLLGVAAGDERDMIAREIGGRVSVLEVNDNPNVDGDVEDAALHAALYERIMTVIRKRIEGRRHARNRA